MRGRGSRSARLAIAAVASAAGSACLAAPPDGGSDDRTQLLANGDFERGLADWEFTGEVEIAPADELGLPSPQAGAMVALLGGANLETDQMSQVVLVPGWATSLELTGHGCFTTAEPFVEVWDVLVVGIEPVAGGVREVLLQQSNLDASDDLCSWMDFRRATDGHAGEEIRLVVEALNDDAGPTSFAVDNLALTAHR